MPARERSRYKGSIGILSDDLIVYEKIEDTFTFEETQIHIERQIENAIRYKGVLLIK